MPTCRVNQDDSTDVYFCRVAERHDASRRQLVTTEDVAISHQVATLQRRWQLGDVSGQVPADGQLSRVERR